MLAVTGIFAHMHGYAQKVRPTPDVATVNVNGQRPQAEYALPWKTIMEADIAWKKRVWRNIDLKDAQNAPFVYDAAIGKEKNLANILAKGALEGKYKVYSPVNDRFTQEISAEEISVLNNGRFAADKVVGYRIKEDWMWLKNEHRMAVRIVGIAPMMEGKDENGKPALQPVFWVYHADARQYLAAHEVYNGGLRTGMNWDELFERGNFRGAADKTVDTKNN